MESDKPEGTLLIKVGTHGVCVFAWVSIPGDSAMPIRLIPPPCSDLLRHPIPEHSATPL